VSAQEKIKKELESLVSAHEKLISLAGDLEKFSEFGVEYQIWYSKALRVVSALASDREEEFVSYYRIDPKRKIFSYPTYVIQDYLKAVDANRDHYRNPLWNVNQTVQQRVTSQVQILRSLYDRVDGVLQDVTGHLFAELQDKELDAARQLINVSQRASGALAGVVLERHLQRVADNHQVRLGKRNPTISDLNDPLKQKGVYGIPVWRKIQLLADIRNMCSHQKSEEPTKEQVLELIDGVNAIIKGVF